MEESKLVYSTHCQTISRDGKSVDLQIYRSEIDDWILEVVDEFGNSTVWDDTFSSDDRANTEFLDALAREGIDERTGRQLLLRLRERRLRKDATEADPGQQREVAEAIERVRAAIEELSVERA